MTNAPDDGTQSVDDDTTTTPASADASASRPIASAGGWHETCCAAGIVPARMWHGKCCGETGGGPPFSIAWSGWADLT